MAAVRRAAGLSQLGLSEALGVGKSYVSKVERGEMYGDVMVFVDWCPACEVPPEETITKLM